MIKSTRPARKSAAIAPANSGPTGKYSVYSDNVVVSFGLGVGATVELSANRSVTIVLVVGGSDKLVWLELLYGWYESGANVWFERTGADVGADGDKAEGAVVLRARTEKKQEQGLELCCSSVGPVAATLLTYLIEACSS
jgi:hypothetical protein